MPEPDAFNPSISFISDGDAVFQVLNADDTDWDEAATKAAYETWLADKAAAKPLGFFARLFS